jgi:hypothetical protein
MRAERRALRRPPAGAGRRVGTVAGKVAALCWSKEINAATSSEDGSEAFALPYLLVIRMR